MDDRRRGEGVHRQQGQHGKEDVEPALKEDEAAAGVPACVKKIGLTNDPTVNSSRTRNRAGELSITPLLLSAWVAAVRLFPLMPLPTPQDYSTLGRGGSNN